MSTEHYDAPEEQPVEKRAQNPGASLRLERERQGLSTTAAAATLRLPEKILLHIEAGRFDQLPGETFARGYVRSYARMLGLDANRLVLEYDSYAGVVVRERNVSAIDKLTPPGKASHLLVTWSSVIIALIILASVLVWWYDSRPVTPPAQDTSAVEQLIEDVEVDALPLPAGVAREEEAPTTEDTDVMVEGDTAAPVVGLASPAPAVPVDDAPPAPSAPEAQSTIASESAPATTESASATAEAASQGLHMRFNGSCWLQVTAVGGQVLHSSLMQAGQSLNIDHDGPVDLVIGAVEAVSQIEYRGQPVDMQSYRPAGVVRIRLGQ